MRDDIVGWMLREEDGIAEFVVEYFEREYGGLCEYIGTNEKMLGVKIDIF